MNDGVGVTIAVTFVFLGVGILAGLLWKADDELVMLRHSQAQAWSAAARLDAQLREATASDDT